MKRHLAYLKYVLRHKWFVLLAGLKLGVPLIWLLLHDWDKFLPDEWYAYAHTFYNEDGTKKDYAETDAFTEAWMKHQHRNKHHWQWWLNAGSTPLHQTNVMVWDRGTAFIVIDGKAYDWTQHGTISVREPMSPRHRLEMLADWMGAGKAITGNENPAEWYLKNRDKMKLHPETRQWIEEQLGV